jgi:hypothetical protein
MFLKVVPRHATWNRKSTLLYQMPHRMQTANA